MFGSLKTISACAFLALSFSMPLAMADEMDRPIVDEAEKDASFVTFRTALRDAIRKNDVDAIVAAADENIHLDFGGGAGRGEFRQRLIKGSSPEESGEKYRAELAKALAFGGRFRNPTTFEAPYTFNEPLREDQDFYDAFFVIAADVPVRREPSLTSEVMGKVSFELMLYDPEAGFDEAFAAVSSEDERVKGYVERQYLKSPLDYRAIFDLQDGKWVMTAFIAGD